MFVFKLSQLERKLNSYKDNQKVLYYDGAISNSSQHSQSIHLALFLLTLKVYFNSNDDLIKLKISEQLELGSNNEFY